MSLCQTAVSARIRSAYCCGVFATGSIPKSISFCRMAGWLMASATCFCKALITSGGVLAGARGDYFRFANRGLSSSTGDYNTDTVNDFIASPKLNVVFGPLILFILWLNYSIFLDKKMRHQLVAHFSKTNF